MTPGNDELVASGRESGRRIMRWFIPIRCSICVGLIWLYSIVVKEPVEAPEPRQEWVLCKPCYRALLMELRRSTLRSPTHLRVAVGLVAAERSPHAYSMSTTVREQQEFQREFAWFARLLILFTLFHVVLFVILLAVPK